MWHGLKVFYYDPNKDELLLDAIGPILAELRRKETVSRAYARRHWKGGPHVRVYVETDAQTFLTSVMPDLIGHLRAYLSAHPSTYRLDATAYELLSQQLGAHELVPGPYTPLVPDNTVMPLEPGDDTPANVLGTPELVELVASYLADTHDLAFELLADTCGAITPRLLRLGACMIAISNLFPGGLRYGHLSYRSHAEGFLFESASERRDEFVRLYQTAANRLRDIVAEILSHSTGGVYHGSDQFLHRWSLVHSAIYQQYQDLSKQGVIPSRRDSLNEAAVQMGTAEQGHWNHASWPMSPFHQLVFSKHLDVLTSPDFAAFRWLLNSFYMQLSTLGIGATRRYLLCYWVAEATEHMLDLTWQSLLG